MASVNVLPATFLPPFFFLLGLCQLLIFNQALFLPWFSALDTLIGPEVARSDTAVDILDND